MKLYPNVSIIFCIWVLAILAIFFFGFSTLPHSGLFPDDFLKSFANWDGGHYLGIADGGYDTSFQYAFFPFYPLLINLVSRITHNFLAAGILISVVSALLGLNFFYTLVKMEFGTQFAEKAVIMLLMFPMSFYFLTVYSEGLFFLLAIATFVFVRKNNLFLATITASLASATRLAGLAVVMGFWVNLYFTGRINQKNWFVIFAPFGFILYAIYLYMHTGDPFYFITAEKYWHRSLIFPGWAIFDTLGKLLEPTYFSGNFRVFWDLIFIIFGIGMVIKVWRKLKADLAVFSIISIILPLFSPTLLAVPRYVLLIFPVFMVSAFYKNKFVLFFYHVFSLLLLSGFAILFMTGNWVS